MRWSTIVAVLAFPCATFPAIRAQANCNSANSCFSETNSNTGFAMDGTSDGIAISGISVGPTSGASIGLSGQSSVNGGYGVKALASSIASGSSWGVYAEADTSSGIGVEGYSAQGYVGVYGVAAGTSGNGVYGQNGDTAGTVPAISSFSGSASTGLAYFGNGGIIISSSVAEKSGGGSWTATSDARVKKNMTPFTAGLKELLQVKPITYQYNGLGGTTADGRTYVGVVAQELEKVLPEMVSSRKARFHIVDTKEVDIKRVDPSEFTYLLINAVKEQQQIIQEQDNRIAALESRTNSLASVLPSGRSELAFMLGLVPVGLVVAIRRRRQG
jgi:hypothetical protein